MKQYDSMFIQKNETGEIYHLCYTDNTREVIPYEPHLAPQVAEITNAESRAVEAARLAQCRERLTNLLPVTGPRRETGESLAVSFFALREHN